MCNQNRSQLSYASKQTCRPINCDQPSVCLYSAHSVNGRTAGVADTPSCNNGSGPALVARWPSNHQNGVTVRCCALARSAQQSELKLASAVMFHLFLVYCKNRAVSKAQSFHMT